MHNCARLAAALLLAGGMMGAARAENVVQLKGTLDDPKMQCLSQLTNTAPESGYFNAGYNANEWDNLNYPIVVGDYLEYEVLVPKESTLHGGAVDGNLSATPRKAGGATIRDAYITEDQNGLFAHPATNYDTLANRVTQVCGQNGQPQNVPLFQIGQWYKRQIDLSKLAIDDNGDPVMLNNLFVAVDAHDTTHLSDLCPVDPNNANFIALFRNINIKNHDAQGKEVVKKAIYNGEGMLPDGKTSTDVGASAAKATVGIIQNP